MFVLFLTTILTLGSSAHGSVTQSTAVFKNRAACEAALVANLAEAEAEGLTRFGHCAPVKVKAPKR